MRFLVLSDTHGDLSRICRAMDYLIALKPDALIHLGDLSGDAELIGRELRVPVYAVAGNCDGGCAAAPQEMVVEEGGVRLFLCHGHRYGVREGVQRLLYAAQERECAVALFGHTHTPFLAREQGVLIMNPGSLCRPRASEAGLGLVTVEGGAARGLALPWRGAI